MPEGATISPVDRSSGVGSGQKRPPLRIRSLDGLRGIAALGVVFQHLTTDYNARYHPVRTASVVFPYAGYAVGLFFLISGFVIFMTVERADRPRDFVISRFTRLFPTYWSAVVITTLVLVLMPPPDVDPPARVLRRAAANLVMVHNWFGIGSIDAVYWTLRVEMSFYVIMLVLIWKRARHLAVPVMTALTSLGICDHLIFRGGGPGIVKYLEMLFILDFAPMFTVGIVLYRSLEEWKPYYALVLLICAIAPATLTWAPHSPVADPIVFVALSLVVCLATRGKLEFLGRPWFFFLGEISYSLYASHHWIGVSTLHRLQPLGLPPDLNLALVVILVVALAAALTWGVERPLMGKARRLLKTVWR